MCDEIKITKVADDKIEVRTPYNPQFVSKIKTAGARWNAIDKAWTMHAANIDVAREILRACIAPLQWHCAVARRSASRWLKSSFALMICGDPQKTQQPVSALIIFEYLL